jgi:hypothetical protein
MQTDSCTIAGNQIPTAGLPNEWPGPLLLSLPEGHLIFMPDRLLGWSTQTLSGNPTKSTEDVNDDKENQKEVRQQEQSSQKQAYTHSIGHIRQLLGHPDKALVEIGSNAADPDPHHRSVRRCETLNN